MGTTPPGEYRVWSGAYCGMTVAEVFTQDPSRVRWYAKQRTKLGHAARLYLQAVKCRRAEEVV